MNVLHSRSVVIIMFLISLLSFQETSTKNRPRMVLINRLEVCYIPENPPYKVHYVDLTYLPDHNYTLSASAEIFETMQPKDLYGDVYVVRCQNKDAPDTCEDFAHLTPPMHVCKFFLVNELGIAKAANSVVPPVRCPLEKGNYTVTDLTYKLSDFTLFPIGNYYWKVRVNGFYKKRLVVTVCYEAQTIDRTVLLK